MACLTAILAGAIAASALAAPPAGPSRVDLKATECGSIEIFEIRVTKGEIPCTQALGVSRKFLKSRQCGSGNEPACVQGEFHCQLASFETQRKTGIGAYCYVLVHPLPAAKDHSPYRLSSFSRAIAIYVKE